jgi:hypothetical protein
MVDGGIEQREVLRYCAVATVVPIDSLMTGIREAYRAVDGYLGSVGLEERGPAIVRYRRVSRSEPLHVEVGWVMPDFTRADPPYIAGELPPGTYVVGWHNGPYVRIGEFTRELIAWGDEQGVEWRVERDGDGERWASWYELYLSEPSFGPEGPVGSVEVALLLRGADLRDH